MRVETGVDVNKKFFLLSTQRIQACTLRKIVVTIFMEDENEDIREHKAYFVRLQGGATHQPLVPCELNQLFCRKEDALAELSHQLGTSPQLSKG